MSSIYKVFIPTYLYIKQHEITGKLYFGKTTRNPTKYKGSGKHWKSHINKHGKHIETLWYCLYTDEQTIRETALSFSKLWNIVESSEWLNLIEEDGIDCHSAAGQIGANKQKNKLWITDGTTEIMVDKHFCIPEGFHKGRLFQKAFSGGSGRHLAKGTTWWNNGKEEKMSITKPDETFNLGRLSGVGTNKTQQSLESKEKYLFNPKYCCVCNSMLTYEKLFHKSCSAICNQNNRSVVRKLFWFNKNHQP